MARLVVFAFSLGLMAAAAAADYAARPGSLERPLPGGGAVWRPAQDDYTECDGVGAGQNACADNCTKVLLCMGGSLDPIVLEECEPPLACNAAEGACVNDSSSCETVTSTILCNALGVFPDTRDCTSYHICSVVGEQSVRARCESGWAYDPLTTLCSKALTDSVCSNLPIECSTLGDSDAFPGNPNIYYICIADSDGNLIPELFRCPHGGSYDSDTYTCVESSS